MNTISAKIIAAGLSCIGLIGSGVGIGVIFGCLLLSLAKNPLQEEVLFKYAILGFALTEAIALFALMMSFLIRYGF